MKMGRETRENQSEHNLLTSFDEVVELIRQIEGEAWYNNHIDEVREAAERVRQCSGLKIDSDQVVAGFYGDGGITRWKVMVNGEVRFSAFHDIGDRERVKTKKAEELGFMLF